MLSIVGQEFNHLTLLHAGRVEDGDGEALISLSLHCDGALQEIFANAVLRVMVVGSNVVGET